MKEVSKLKGKMRFDIDAKMEYDSWYVPLRETYRTNPDKTGVVPRMHTGVLKLAVILAIAKRLDLIVKKEDIQEGIEECMSLLPNYSGFQMTVGKSPEAVAGSLLLDEMWRCGGSITKQAFLVKYWYEVSAETLQKLVITLNEAGMIVLDMRNAEAYVMTKVCRDMFEKGREFDLVKRMDEITCILVQDKEEQYWMPLQEYFTNLIPGTFIIRNLRKYENKRPDGNGKPNDVHRTTSD